ncbi:MAG: 50S ribosomal protein L2 [Patescibacteria group bacterium]
MRRKTVQRTAYKILAKKKPEKKLLLNLKKKAGRSSSGRLSIRHRGGGVKTLYRIVDFGQKMIDMPAKVIALEYDPNRTAFLALLEYENGEKTYRIAAHGMKVGDSVICAEKAEPEIGNRMKLKNIPSGTPIFNIEIIPGNRSKMVRSAGTSAQIIAKEGKYCNIQMPSKEIRKILLESFATMGQVSHPEKRFEKLGKAGTKRRKGWRPTVRGSAMNPRDHPHGGGEGKAPIGMPGPKTKWGKPAMGVKTRTRKSTNKYIIKRRQQQKRK